MEEPMSFEELQEITSICLDELIKLKEEKAQLEAKVEQLSLNIAELTKGEQTIIDKVCQNTEAILLDRKIMHRSLQNLRYELHDPKTENREWYYPEFYEIDETIDAIIHERKSMARFGDGEFAIMSNVVRQKFQHLDDRLAKRLVEVLHSHEDNLLVGIADNYGNLDHYNEGGRNGIRYYMTEEVRKEHSKYIEKGRKYHNAYISRPYALFEDNTTDAPAKRFAALRKIWDGKDVIFVEGSLTGLGVGNDLFDNAKSIKRIEVPAESSFDKYDEILEAALKYGNKDSLFMIAMGPSAGVLAYDLCLEGYQALDIGHMDLEYEWYLQGNGGRAQVSNKYNNEYPGGDVVEPITDPKYLSQIICKID